MNDQRGKVSFCFEVLLEIGIFLPILIYLSSTIHIKHYTIFKFKQIFHYLLRANSWQLRLAYKFPKVTPTLRQTHLHSICILPRFERLTGSNLAEIDAYFQDVKVLSPGVVGPIRIMHEAHEQRDIYLKFTQW